MAEYTSYANNPLSSSACNPEPGNNGNIAYIADTVNVGWTQSFAYDGLNRLLTAARSDGGYNHTYNYDSFGNLIVQDNLNTNPTFTVNPATNQLNRWNGPVNLYTYDAAGNITSTGTSDIGGHTFNYNPLSQITSVDGNLTGSYTYNGLDERVYTQTGSISTNYIYFNSQPMSEWVSTGVWTDYIYAEGQKIAKIATPLTGSATLNYYLDDHLGTTQVELSSDGHVLWQGQFTPFGSELPDGSTTMHYKFTGKERDAESGLDYFGARYYASAAGRWMSPDWSAQATPVPYAKLGNPQSLNLYSYVGNNPLRSVDPDGHADVAAQCAGKASCKVSVTDTVNIVHYDKKTKTSVVDSTLKVTTNFSVTTDAKGNMSASASSTVENVSGHAYSDGQLATMGKDIGAVQQAAVTMGFGANTTQMMTAVGAGETVFGTAKAGESSPFKAPSINPLQLSGGRANGDLNHNIQGALNVFDYFGRKVDFDPIPTYRGYSDGSVPTMSNFTAIYNSVSETQK